MKNTIENAIENMDNKNGLVNGVDINHDIPVTSKPKKTTVKIKKSSPAKTAKPKTGAIVVNNTVVALTEHHDISTPSTDENVSRETIETKPETKNPKTAKSEIKKPKIEMKFGTMDLSRALNIDTHTVRVWLRKLGIAKNATINKYGWDEQSEFDDVVNQIQTAMSGDKK